MIVRMFICPMQWKMTPVEKFAELRKALTIGNTMNWMIGEIDI